MKITDDAFLDKEYGEDTANLAGRCEFYDRFQSKPPSWQEWLFRQISLQGEQRVLDVGCGDGSFWRSAVSKGLIPTGTSVVLIDRSRAMVKECLATFAGDGRFSFVQAEATSWLRQTRLLFDVILAGHVIYHLNRPEVFIQVARERLVPQGKLAVTSVGQDHLAGLALELEALYLEIGLVAPTITPPTFRTSESLELLFRGRFGKCRVSEYRADLSVDELGPLIDFLNSCAGKSAAALEPALLESVAHSFRLPFETEAHNFLVQGWNCG